jgi:hypothetical protein
VLISFDMQSFVLFIKKKDREVKYSDREVKYSDREILGETC